MHVHTQCIFNYKSCLTTDQGLDLKNFDPGYDSKLNPTLVPILYHTVTRILDLVSFSVSVFSNYISVMVTVICYILLYVIYVYKELEPKVG